VIASFPLPEPFLEGIDYELWGQNAKADVYSADLKDAQRWRRLLWAVEREFPILWVTEDPENDPIQLTTAARIIDVVDGLDIPKADRAMLSSAPTGEKP
jgi:hypothetical protein